MTGTNIINFSNYLFREPTLSGMNSYSRKNIKILHSINPYYSRITEYIFFNIEARKDTKEYVYYVEATTFEFTKDWHKGICDRAYSSKYLKELCELNVLKKVNTNQRCRKYRVNPIFLNVLTKRQRKAFKEHDYLLFNPHLLKPEFL
jgi:hypothetical protein